MQMFDPVMGRFNAGTVPAGTSGSGICPNGQPRGNDIINTCDFLDSNTFTTLALATSPRYQHQIDWTQPIQYATANFAQTVTAAGQTFQGFDIVPAPVSGANGIAWEFTGQIVAAIRVVDKLYGNSQLQATADFYLGQISNAQALAPFGDGNGLVASTLENGDSLAPLSQCLNTPFQCIPERVGLAATAWAIAAEGQSNLFTSSTATFVNQLYVDLFERQADPTGLSNWISQLAGHQETRSEVALDFFLSPEFQTTSLLVTNCYLGVLARDPDFGGWVVWTDQVRAGLTPLNLVTGFLDSAEGQVIYGGLDNAGFVGTAYLKVLQRPADADGFAYWVSQLNTGTLTREQVMLAFVTSTEFSNLIGSHSAVDQLYLALLRRAGENASVLAWTTQLNAGTPLQVVIGDFLASDEYRSRLN